MQRSRQTSAFEDEQIARYGLLMHGRDLHRALGFNSYAGFYKALKLGQLPVQTFPIEGRRGLFAHTGEVARWLLSQSAAAASMDDPIQEHVAPIGEERL